MRPQIVLMIPLGDSPGHPDHGLPGVPARPDQGLPGQPPRPSQGPGFPTQPIHLPPLPPGGALPPGLGGTPEHPIYHPPVAGQGPGFPTNPIAPGGQPPGIWDPGHPDQGLPGQPPIASTGPGFPTHPIVLPPGSPEPPPGSVWPPIAGLHTKTVTLAWLPGYGYRWITVEPPTAQPV
jgi:hypothetical protein